MIPPLLSPAQACDLVSELSKYALGLLCGTLGGLTFAWAGLPLPWMLGALFASMVAAVAGLPVRGPDRIRPIVIVVIGVLLGSRFSPDVLAQAGAWATSLSILAVYLIVVGACVVPFYRYVGKQDWTTSYFAGMPGGLTEMIEFGEARGANVQAIVLAHSLRVVVTIAIIAFWFRIVMGHDVGAQASGASGFPAWNEALMLLAAGVLGAVLGRALHFPAPSFLGPLLVSAALHVSGLSKAAPPDLLVNGAQVILGTVLGCRFRGVPLRALAGAGALSVGSTLITLAIALGFAAFLEHALAIDSAQAILAFAPGGLTEMGLIALAIRADVAFVALHHVVRILLLIVGAPLAFGLIARLTGEGRLGPKPPKPGG